MLYPGKKWWIFGEKQNVVSSMSGTWGETCIENGGKRLVKTKNSDSDLA